MENINHLWVNSVLNMVLFVKPLHPIQGNDECADIDKFWFTSKLMGGKVYFLTIIFSINCLKRKPMRYPMNI